MPTKFKLNDIVKLNPDESEELKKDIKYSALDFNARYKIIKIDNFQGLNHYRLQQINTKEIFCMHKYIPYAFIDAEILLVQHDKEFITSYLEKLIFHRFSKEELQYKIINDFQQQEFSISKNDWDTVEEDDDSFIFTLTFEELLVDVTLFYIYTNKKDTFLITEVAYEFANDLKYCIYCDDKNLASHYLCAICGVGGMCDVCNAVLVERGINFINILENCDTQREIELITEVCGEAEYLCEVCLEGILR